MQMPADIRQVMNERIVAIAGDNEEFAVKLKEMPDPDAMRQASEVLSALADVFAVTADLWDERLSDDFPDGGRAMMD